MNEEVKKEESTVTINSAMVTDLINMALKGQEMATRLDAVLKYALTAETIDKKALLLIAGVNVQNESRGEVPESQKDEKKGE